MIRHDEIREAVSTIITAIGEDPLREGLVDTPRRVADVYEEFCSGIGQDPSEVLATSYEEAHQEAVILRSVSFVSLCEHHFLPFFGTAHMGYLPKGRVIGVSKLARALDILCRRPQLQERLTRQLADCIFDAVEPVAVTVFLSAEHTCMTLRGIKSSGSKLVTSSARGEPRAKEELKRELYAIIGEGLT